MLGANTGVIQHYLCRSYFSTCYLKLY